MEGLYRHRFPRARQLCYTSTTTTLNTLPGGHSYEGSVLTNTYDVKYIYTNINAKNATTNREALEAVGSLQLRSLSEPLPLLSKMSQERSISFSIKDIRVARLRRGN